MKKVLVFGLGNHGRQDDGLGIKLVDILEKEGMPNLTLDANFQLNIEDAFLIKDFDIVIFADASVEKDICFFRFERLEPSTSIEFTTHAMHPSSVLALCIDLYKVHPDCYLLTMPGYAWEMKEGLTSKAQENLQVAFEFIKSFSIVN